MRGGSYTKLQDYAFFAFLRVLLVKFPNSLRPWKIAPDGTIIQHVGILSTRLTPAKFGGTKEFIMRKILAALWLGLIMTLVHIALWSTDVLLAHSWRVWLRAGLPAPEDGDAIDEPPVSRTDRALASIMNIRDLRAKQRVKELGEDL